MLTVMPKRSKDQSPEDCLKEALAKAAEMENVLILYEGSTGEACGSFDNGMTVAQCLYLMELYRHWLLNACLEKDS